MNQNGYPFLSRRQILERIAAEPGFAAECVAIIQQRHEQRETSGGESSGWMASHAAKATKLAAKLASDEATERERSEAAQLVKSYARQLARVFRDRELAARPDLGAQAAVFGVGTDATRAAVAVDTPSVPEARTAALEQAPTPKRHRRPRGSRNKPKTDQPVRRRRSRT